METRNRRRRNARSARACLAAVFRMVAARCARAARNVRMRIRPWQPEVCVDLERGDARRLRRTLRRVAREYIRALGVTAPEALLLIVQRVVVQDGRELAALLQVFEDEAGRQRTVVFLALSIEGRAVDDEELPALLRHELQHLLAGQLGSLVLSVPLEPAHATADRVIPIRSGQESSPFEDAPPVDQEYEGYVDGAFAAAER